MMTPEPPVSPPHHAENPQVRLAEDRTILAAERTYASWLRTGLSFLVVGLAAQRFLREVLPGSPLLIISLAMILCAVVCFGSAAWRDAEVRKRLGARTEVRLLPRAIAAGLPLFLIISSAVSAAFLATH